ncbi:MAG: ferredoxin family protein [Deltaproteobacteria bacterium]|nr:MAG: ferredoxin family protein [Deltaproteobacteria bacterium]
MPEIRIAEECCRGCRLCLDVCPVEVFGFDEARERAQVVAADDCIACLSCAFICPATAIELTGYHAVKNFYRDRIFSRRVERYL